MKKVIDFLKHFRQSCWRCHGMGQIELPSGDVKTCPVCKGKGML